MADSTKKTKSHRGIAREGYTECTDNDCWCHDPAQNPAHYAHIRPSSNERLQRYDYSVEDCTYRAVTDGTMVRFEDVAKLLRALTNAVRNVNIERHEWYAHIAQPLQDVYQALGAPPELALTPEEIKALAGSSNETTEQHLHWCAVRIGKNCNCRSPIRPEETSARLAVEGDVTTNWSMYESASLSGFTDCVHCGQSAASHAITRGRCPEKASEPITLCAVRGPSGFICERPQGHSGRHYDGERRWDRE